MTFAAYLQMPLVSIVIPCRNAASRIDACLTSCVQQTYPNLEIIAVNNCSTDETRDRIKQWINQSDQTIRLLDCEEPGANRARNFGFQNARGDYIQWLDSDDELALDKIEQQVEALERNPTIDIAYSDWHWRFHTDNDSLIDLVFTTSQYQDFRRQALIDNWHPPHSYLLRRGIAQKLHDLTAWHPQTRVTMDREYFSQAALLDARFLYVPQTHVSYHCWDTNQITRSTSYPDRVHTLSAIFQRLQNSAANHPNSLSSEHILLLNQNWNRWRPAPFTVAFHSPTTFLLHHSETQATQQVSYSEGMILGALLKSTAPCTLEDHARQIVRRLWHAIVVRNPAADFAETSQILAQAVGLSISSAETSSANTPASQTPSFAHATESSDLRMLSQALPLYAPVFGEHRFAVFQVLERFCQQGWLEIADESP